MLGGRLARGVRDAVFPAGAARASTGKTGRIAHQRHRGALSRARRDYLLFITATTSLYALVYNVRSGDRPPGLPCGGLVEATYDAAP